MAQLMRCRSCGYVLQEKELGGICPACGVPRKMFEAWADPVSERRRILLGFDAHPIIDHFTISFAASAFVLSLFVFIFPQVFRQTLTGIVRGLIIVLPFAVISSFLSGLFDGKVRFRRTNTPLLTRKKVLGGLFFLFSAAVAVLTFAVGPFETWVRALNAALLAGCVGCAAALGRIGGTLLTAMFPG